MTGRAAKRLASDDAAAPADAQRRVAYSVLVGSGWTISLGPGVAGRVGATAGGRAACDGAAASGGGGRFCWIALVTLGAKPARGA
ncbi:MAG: hypothetical protein JHD32_11725, partial [Sphingobium sp.]|nr:hypothetical protein [Sphingobium sp.]